MKSDRTGYFGNERKIRELAVMIRANINPTWGATDVANGLKRLAIRDDELFLDLVDGSLEIFSPGSLADELARLLDLAGSVWTVAPDRRALTRVVNDQAQATYEEATSVADAATGELKEAWANAFGRSGDPSDAWDHAIKAVEDVLIPEMMPNNGNATLSNVVGELAGQNGAQWRLVLPGNDQTHDVGALVAMLRLMWPNHDRHGGSTPKRTASEQEARAVVTLAATIVQWHREGWVVQKR
ncbi:hypothetical protein ACEWX3_10585 [Mycobacterium sp. G7A2]|uniref:hypothetical protein n=1 Tax=Mycobacterium sp. G7A2 TaxID=3317307 RepID=UPI0035A9A52A